MINMAENKKGFTLAEVLITLGIIGVVAALTIPALIANYQKTQYVTRLKKAYSEITEALKLMANDAGCSDNLKCNDVFDSNDSDLLGNEFKKYFKVAKDCGIPHSSSDVKCFSNSANANFDGSASFDWYGNWANSGDYEFITTDGFGIDLLNLSSGKCLNGGTDIVQSCGEVTLDVNGLNGPNTIGRDIFAFVIINGKGPALYPIGCTPADRTKPDTGIYDQYGWYAQSGPWSDDSGNAVKCYADNTEGLSCTGRIMEQGWQMKY